MSDASTDTDTLAYIFVAVSRSLKVSIKICKLTDFDDCACARIAARRAGSEELYERRPYFDPRSLEFDGMAVQLEGNDAECTTVKKISNESPFSLVGEPAALLRRRRREILGKFIGLCAHCERAQWCHVMASDEHIS